MSDNKTISGFSKLSKPDKVKWVAEHFFQNSEQATHELLRWWNPDEEQQRLLDGFSENTLSNFPMPFGVAPNFLINGKVYAVPMVIEESSVVAAASSAAKYWLDRGGFHAKVLGIRKLGQVHFTWSGDVRKLESVFEELKTELRQDAAPITVNMERRGGGVTDIELVNFTDQEPGYYQLKVSFETCDSMGANFINSVLECFAKTLDRFISTHPIFDEGDERDVTIIMSILSNYTPECLVRAWVECPVEKLGPFDNGLEAAVLAEKFRKAVRIAQIDPHRAATHNKGIFNGVDAVVLATANDFRAVEAGCHTFAARDGQYRSLSHCTIEDGVFRFWLDLPLALGTVGGLTKLHPIAKLSLEMLGNPSAEELMMIIASTGLAQNFAAVRSLVTTGIQSGHMKMHLANILNHLGANADEAAVAMRFFEGKTVSFTGVREYLEGMKKSLLI
ncbi:MAG: hydroxymethylglutaryl-CoA reductase, degradative [Saprospiraceae bacterium]|nr:hydroxymethylglutaryl-CoA reductase, degradative [Saprospiraceae bacterium]MCF8252305.1 hydroxymethylglutaryl-CoA reductase, degradative [Saprospiraceae bacterium]MCF8282165.1 hydroxymethylglutaryl-CoA reductase, degradative [Bacteroidales bacterium]MCF8313947.1 hydroxymethylglutaryl-CoA reductase, degradative [Saprospiraceae bacterium]MCF8442657.1 hydroxymethylglutaryl-CoA reductase, degradative [Saprospiraceae bacterium]